VDDKTPVAGSGLALGACEGVLITSNGVQKHGEIAAYLAKAEIPHLPGCRADDDVVSLLDIASQQPIAYRPADKVDLGTCGSKAVGNLARAGQSHSLG
jgi:hypothetical protein